MENSQEFEVEEKHAGERLDRVLVPICETKGLSLSRARIQELIKAGDITVNGATVKPRQALTTGDLIKVVIPEPKSDEILAQDIPLNVLFEDEHLIVLNKPHGLVIHPAAGNADGTLVNALVFHCQGNLSDIGGGERPGIVHRLDKDTSGCLVAAKSNLAHQGLVEQFSNRETRKVYLAVVNGVPHQLSGRIENRIGRHPVNRQKMAVLENENAGKIAITEYDVIDTHPDSDWAVVECRILTGRTHQIRVHMKESLHCAILGDPIYAQTSRQNTAVPRLMLHAWKLSFTHPATGERVDFQANPPAEFSDFLTAIATD